VSSVFYTLALINLPQLYMATFFVRAVETMSELRVSLQRLNAFLSLPEPPVPAHQAGSATCGLAKVNGRPLCHGSSPIYLC
jgi:hypothetical protein